MGIDIDINMHTDVNINVDINDEVPGIVFTFSSSYGNTIHKLRTIITTHRCSGCCFRTNNRYRYRNYKCWLIIL